MNRYEAESIDEDLILADREKAAAELRRLRQQNKMLGQAARECNERLVKAQSELEAARPAAEAALARLAVPGPETLEEGE